MFKTQVEPPATGEWFHCKVLITVRFKLLFTITIIIEVSPKIPPARKTKTEINCKAPPRSFALFVLLSTIALHQIAQVL